MDKQLIKRMLDYIEADITRNEWDDGDIRSVEDIVKESPDSIPELWYELKALENKII